MDKKGKSKNKNAKANK